MCVGLMAAHCGSTVIGKLQDMAWLHLLGDGILLALLKTNDAVPMPIL